MSELAEMLRSKKKTHRILFNRVNYLNEIESPQNANTLRLFNTHTLLKINAEL